MNIRDLLQTASPVMPVLTIDDATHAVPLGRALLQGGLRAVEITLRTDAAIPSITALREALPELIVGAGTVLTPELMRSVRDAGGQFAVSPGYTETLADAAEQYSMPFLPGAVTAGEIQMAMERGFDTLKLFPAAAVGGAALLASFASVFPDVSFCPTGGVSAENMHIYLSLPNVVCVGGSWLAPKNRVQAQDWDAIRHLAAAAVAVKKHKSD